ncbi:GntG family PLP-dependent aldolase [Kribbella sp. NPDC023855]|uniref:threonine aldolase family protein n=1 Tax=Kribbella sp. NPDC023855 TaxID=3154698 RepID=UPI0033EDC5F7
MVQGLIEKAGKFMTTHRWIDLRTDAVAQPTSAMREAIAAAVVGSDQFGEDPSVNSLQKRMADLLGKQAGLFVPSGTMANQLALKLFCQPGDDVLVGRESHSLWHETGSGAALAGVQFTTVGQDGTFAAADVEAVLKPRGHMLYPPTTLIQVENTHNRMGGRVWDLGQMQEVCALAKERGVATFCDGARIFNAAIALSVNPALLAEGFDLVAVSLTKGLGCPIGSVLVGSAEHINRLVRYRRMLGGTLHQAGIAAAAGLYALDHHVERLAEDHAHARLISEALAELPGVSIDLERLETNLIVCDVPDAVAVAEYALKAGVKVLPFGPRRLRACTHLDVSREDSERAADVLTSAVRSCTSIAPDRGSVLLTGPGWPAPVGLF